MLERPFLLLLFLLFPGGRPPAQSLFVEAESFRHTGGWVRDTQFMDQMGSPFLLAHGLGVPVTDAWTPVTFPEPGKYRLWVRTRDWTAPWKTREKPGRFRVLLGGVPVPVVFGVEGNPWHWQDGGVVEVKKVRTTLGLHDLTGFEGRCDAIFLTKDLSFRPPDGGAELARFRRRLLGLPGEPLEAGTFDLVVTGGGISGICAAVAAARLGVKTALIQDRPVLGGNNSSEVRVWLGGAINVKPFPRVGDIVRELKPPKRPRVCPWKGDPGDWDRNRELLVRAEKNLTLFLNHRVDGVEMEKGRIRAVLATNTMKGGRVRFRGRWFADTTGDGCVGFLAGADYEIQRKGHMGRSNLWYLEDTGRPSPFPRCPWALDLSDKPFPGRNKAWAGNPPEKRSLGALGKWFWESGFDRDPFGEGEYIRDWNFRAMYGAWDALKNVDHRLGTYRLAWAAYISGKRESRRLLGDVVLTEADLLEGRKFPDGCVPTGWPMDVHVPNPNFMKGFEGDAFISMALYTQYKRPFWVPYRCLYSRNVPNLWMAGRDISVTHKALGAVRVMRTCGCMGEIVGMAAAVCKARNADPRKVFTDYLEDLKTLMRRGVGRRKGDPGTSR